jgi:hypothetical protein
MSIDQVQDAVPGISLRVSQRPGPGEGTSIFTPPGKQTVSLDHLDKVLDFQVPV